MTREQRELLVTLGSEVVSRMYDHDDGMGTFRPGDWGSGDPEIVEEVWRHLGNDEIVDEGGDVEPPTVSVVETFDYLIELLRQEGTTVTPEPEPQIPDTGPEARRLHQLAESHAHHLHDLRGDGDTAHDEYFDECSHVDCLLVRGLRRSRE